MTIHIFKLSIFRLQVMKKINILANIKEYLLQSNNLKGLENLEWLFEADIEDYMEASIDMKVVINDKMHFCCRINKVNSKEYNDEGERYDRHQCGLNYGDDCTQEDYQVYYFENCIHNLVNKEDATAEVGELQSVLVTD